MPFMRFEMDFQGNGFWIHSLAGFWILKAGFWIPMHSIPDSARKNFVDSGIWITLHGAKRSLLFLNFSHFMPRVHRFIYRIYL